MHRDLPDYDSAVARLLADIEPLRTCDVSLGDALGRVLRQEIHADRDQPPFDRSTMDGFAVRSAVVLAGKTFDVPGQIAAGDVQTSLPDDQTKVVRIATGAILPRGADAVVPVEMAQMLEGPQERVRFTIDSVEPGHNVHKQGSDALAEQTVLRPGTRLGPQHIAIAATMGVVRLEVAQLPKISVLTSGDEVHPPLTRGSQLAAHQIRNSNGPMLAALCEALGVPIINHLHLPDEPKSTLQAAQQALSQSDLVITAGGVSVGQRDLLPWAWQELGVETVLHGVAIQPGKPLLVARSGNKTVLGLPGNPVSVLATAHLFLWPLIDRLHGRSGALPWRTAVLGNSVRATSARQVFRPATAQPDGSVRVVHWHGSGDLVHTAVADRLVRLPRSDAVVEPGTTLRVLPLIQ